ncbi:MAG: family 78 glycoside hydrolase catalytic domain [Flavisolibacter sp.]
MTKKYILFPLLVFSLCSFSQGLSVVHLSCENKNNPLGVDRTSPVLGWQIKSDQRNVLQTAYRILIADDSAMLAKDKVNIWDSKKISSDQCVQVKYKGRKLSSVKTYFWKVMVWDNKNQSSPWSEIAHWQMGLLQKSDWENARWIAYEKIPDSLIDILPSDTKKDKFRGGNVLPLLRKTFMVKTEVKKAILYLCGLGQFELSMNGKKIGDHFLDPGWTKYDKQALYVSFDVTDNLIPGNNAVGVMLGNGFYYIPPVAGRYRKLRTGFGFPKMIFRLAIEYKDGLVENIVSDGSWKTSPGPITFSSIYGGEDYDATREQANWNSSGFDDTKWKKAVMVEGPPGLNSQMADPVKIMDTFTGRLINKLSEDSLIYDFGQNASGIARIKLQGRSGDTIRIYPSELLKRDGRINQRPTGYPYYFEYILKGEGVENWQPCFSYYGFRYMQIVIAPKNSKNRPVLIEVSALHTRNAAEKIGSFSCSNELFNKTYSLIDWAIKSNMVSLFTDCPHREKLGWLEQAHLMNNSVCFNYNVRNLYRKQVEDMIYSQTNKGLVPEIVPEYVKFDWGNGMFRDSPEWGSSIIIVPWYLYTWYGDKETLQSSYEAMKKYIVYLQSKAKGYILTQGLGDWYDLGPNPAGVSQLTPMGVTATAIFYYDLNILNKIATLLNKNVDARHFKQLSGKVREAFNDKFFNTELKQYASGSQTANAMAVYMNLVDPKFKSMVMDNIVKDIRSRNNSLTAGDIGYRYLLCVLHDADRDDVIYDMNSRTDVPGYGYQLAKGATALTESWSALPTNSNNHFMLGHLMEWLFRGIGGIDQTENSVAYKEIRIKPEIVGDVNEAEASFQSVYGTISTEWRKQNNSLQIKIELPANTAAVVSLPATALSKIMEGNLPIEQSKEIKMLGWEDGRVKLRVGSGHYLFLVKE